MQIGGFWDWFLRIDHNSNDNDNNSYVIITVIVNDD